MSIALDTALYLREQKSENPLTVAERGVLLTLMFRVGSNPFSWVSQETLAIELDIKERNVRRYMKGIKEKGYIDIIHDPHDKRKNLYRPAKFLINYHQQNPRAQTKKYRSKLSSNSKNTGQNYPVNTGQNYPLSNVAQNATDPVDKGLQEFAQIPKAKVLNNIKRKEHKSFCAKQAFAQQKFNKFWILYPRKKDKKRAEQIWIKNELDYKADEIIKDIKNRLLNDHNWKDPQYIPHPSTYLRFERWQDEITLQIISSNKTKFNPAQYALNKIKQRQERKLS